MGISDGLLRELHNLGRAEKLHIIQMLASELAAEEQPLFKEGAVYEVWSPFDSADAARTLLDRLEVDKKARNA